MKPLLTEFKETTIFKGVILLSIISAIALFLSISFTLLVSDFYDKDGNRVSHQMSWINSIRSLGICFISSFVAYYVVILLFGYGESLIVKN